MSCCTGTKCSHSLNETVWLSWLSSVAQASDGFKPCDGNKKIKISGWKVWHAPSKHNVTHSPKSSTFWKVGQVRDAALFCDLVLFIMYIWLSLHTCLLGCKAFFSTARCILFLAFSQVPHSNYTSQVGQCQLGFPTVPNKCLCFVALTLLHVENGYSKIKQKKIKSGEGDSFSYDVYFLISLAKMHTFICWICNSLKINPCK